MRTISTKLPIFLLAFAASTIANAQDMYVAGPAGRVLQDKAQVSILGQSISIRRSTNYFVGGRRVAAQHFFNELGPGTYLYAEAIGRPGSLDAKSLVLVNNQYVAGATPVFLAGIVASYEASIGRARIGNVDVDVTNVSPDVTRLLKVGDLVELAGTQADEQSPISVSSKFEIAKHVELDGISGSGVAPNGISGSGASTLGISGSGIQVQGISGSGASIQGISGSGVTTTGTSGSRTSTLGISGSGVTTQGISGSGVSVQGISGSGVTAQGISGSGVSVQGISGSGLTTQGISGSGLRTQGISGSGATVQGISGSGSSAQGISGSGVSAQGISGSGIATQGISGSG